MFGFFLNLFLLILTKYIIRLLMFLASFWGIIIYRTCRRGAVVDTLAYIILTFVVKRKVSNWNSNSSLFKIMWTCILTFFS